MQHTNIIKRAFSNSEYIDGNGWFNFTKLVKKYELESGKT